MTVSMVKFLEQIFFPVCEIQMGEINNVKTPRFDEVDKFLQDNRSKNLYFLGNVNPGVLGRAKDSDISIKNYVAFDFDVRKYYSEQGKEITDEKIKLMGDRMIKKLEPDEIFSSVGAVVFSGNGLHLYYFCEATRIEKEIYSSGYEWACVELGKLLTITPDISCRNPARILRLPGSYNNKTFPPKRVEIIYFNPIQSQVLNFILQNGSTSPVKTAIAEPTVDPEKLKGLPLWEQLALLPSKVILGRLSGHRLVNGEVFSFRRRAIGGEYIDVNGKPADCWLDSAGYIGSGKKAGPTWIQWLKNFYGVTPRAIAEFAKEKLADILPHETEKSAENFLPAIEGLCGQQKFFTWGSQKLDEKFSPLQKGKYVVVAGDTGAGKTPFTLNMAIKNARLGHRVLYLSLEIKNHALLFKYARDKLGISKRRFKEEGVAADQILEVVRSMPPTLKFMEVSDNNLESIIAILMETDADMVIIDNIGIIGTPDKDLTEAVRNISRRLLVAKNRKGITIVAVHHFRKLSRKSEEITGDIQKLVRSMDNAMGSAKLSHDIEFFIQVVRDKKAQSDQARAELLVVQQKDRDWGDYASESVFYINGEFIDYFPNQANDVPF